MATHDWIKPRTCLVSLLGFGAWVVSGAVVFGELDMVVFGSICGTAGLFIYGIDCLLQRLFNGCVRPPDVLWTDLSWAACATFLGVMTGLAAPLYV